MQRIQPNKTFVIDGNAKQISDFERAVNDTAKLIQRSYFVTFKLVEDWALHKILRRLKEANETANPQRYWWGMRKKDKELGR